MTLSSNGTAGLQSVVLRSWGLQCGLYSLGVYSLGQPVLGLQMYSYVLLRAYSLEIYSLGQPILELWGALTHP